MSQISQATKIQQQQQKQEEQDRQPSFLDHLEFFNPERIIHHSQRHLRRITEQGTEEEERATEHDIWDRLHVEYAFSYSRKLIRLALNYLTSFRFLERTENANQTAAIVDNHTRIVALQ